MYCVEYTTVNSETKVLVPFINVSHVIEGNGNKNTQHGDTCWIQFLSGKSIHVSAPYKEVAEDIDNFYKSSR